MSWRLACLLPLLTLGCPAIAAGDVTLSLPPQAEVMRSADEPMGSRALPIGPFQNGTIAAKTLTAPLSQTAYRIPVTGRSVTADLMAFLQGQIAAAGFDLIYQCQARLCGGFDFRYGMDLLPEPDMHVDLGDFHYLFSMRGQDAIAIMVSRSPSYGFVQVTKMGDFVAPKPKVIAATKSPEVAAQNAVEMAFSNGDQMVLEGLEFASGSAALAAGQYPVLDQIAQWLIANPGQDLRIMGHTDASGNAASNLALSAARAETIRAWLMTQYGIDGARITTVGLGDSMPRADNATFEGRAKNRRVEVSASG